MVLASMTDTPERRAEADMVDYFRSGLSFYARADEPSVNSSQDLCGKTVGTAEGATVRSPRSMPHQKCTADRMRLMQWRDVSEADQRLRKGQIDPVVTEHPQAAYRVARSHDALRLVVVPGQTRRRPFGIAVGKDDRPLTRAVRSALNDLIGNGTYGKILARWEVGDGSVESAQLNGRR
jgi:polar amino acid transport system substrate-binding protein